MEPTKVTDQRKRKHFVLHEDETYNVDIKNLRKFFTLINSVKFDSGYNVERMQKLKEEFKCSTSYNRSRIDSKPMPDFSNPIYKELDEKFNEARYLMIKLNKHLHADILNIKKAKKYAENSVRSLSRLKEFTKKNLNLVNLAFEDAHFDTYKAGFLNGVGVLFSGIGLISIAVNGLFFNNEFDGKIERAYQEAVDVKKIIFEIEKIIQ